MVTRLRYQFQSFSFRLLIPLFLVMGLIVAVYAWFSFRSTEDHFLSLARDELHRSSELIQRATHDGMLLNRLAEVQVIIERLAEGSNLNRIRVFDKEGAVVLSGQTEEIGLRINLNSTPCSTCHVGPEPPATDRLDTCQISTSDGPDEALRHLSVIKNEASCSEASCHAHPPEEKVLGVLEVEMSLDPLEAALISARRQVVWMTLAMILFIGAISAGLIRRLVHRPILRLRQGTRRIAAGDLSTRIEVKGNHELARLAMAFNSMASDLNNAREELTEWSQKLEDKVVEKTEELQHAQRQVLHMEKMASLGKLSATVAHELNNPISGILTYARLVDRELKDQPLPEDVAEELGRYLSLIDKECTRCGAIVQNLLLFARRRGAQKAPVDLNEIVERSLMLVRHHLEIKGARLHSHLLKDNPEIVADAGQLQQALVALFVNAVEAMEGRDDDSELTVDLQGDEQEVRIDVTDTGIGIPPEVLPRIFEPFFSTKDKESGVGLGLAVVYGIINRHDGNIEVESKAGQGTTFHIRLPRKPKAKE